MTSLLHGVVLPVALLLLLSLALHQATGSAGLSRAAASSASGSAGREVGRSSRGAPRAPYLMASLLSRRRRSMKAGGLWGPPPYNSYFANALSDAAASKNSLKKRSDDEAWIWMPAYGYVPMPADDGTGDDNDDGERIGNLLRYGK